MISTERPVWILDLIVSRRGLVGCVGGGGGPGSRGDAGGVGVIWLGRGAGGGGGCVCMCWNFLLLILFTTTKTVVGSPCVPVRRRMRDLRNPFRSPSIFHTLSPFIWRPRRIWCLVCPEEV